MFIYLSVCLFRSFSSESLLIVLIYVLLAQFFSRLEKTRGGRRQGEGEKSLKTKKRKEKEDRKSGVKRVFDENLASYRPD